MENENIVSGAASLDVAASYSDEEFGSGLSEAFGLEPSADEKSAENEPAAPQGLIGDKGKPGEPGVPQNVNNEGKPAESVPGAESIPERISFVEHGKNFSVPKEAVEVFAKAVGRTAEDFIDIYQKGCGFDALKAKYDEREADSRFFEDVAKERGLATEQVRNEMFASVSKMSLERVVAQIKDENPGIGDKAAEELAKYRMAEAKPKAEQKPENPEGQSPEKAAGNLREIDIFMANHPEVKNLSNEAIEAWEKTGRPLEEVYADFRMREENALLKEKIAALEKEKQQKEQKAYAFEHSTGPANSGAGTEIEDDFVKGLFAQY